MSGRLPSFPDCYAVCGLDSYGAEREAGELRPYHLFLEDRRM
jgi:hypothetical protein